MVNSTKGSPKNSIAKWFFGFNQEFCVYLTPCIPLSFDKERGKDFWKGGFASLRLSSISQSLSKERGEGLVKRGKAPL